MRQHPVPQNIASYQFRLIGDITLKQFLQLLSGGVVGFVFFSTNLPSVIKWFFIIVSVLLGAGLAFMPIEGRSLDKWILAFLGAIYKPTQFHWKKSPKLPDYLTDSSTPHSVKSSPNHPIKKASKPDNHGDIIHKEESGKLDQINKLFSNSPKPIAPIKTITPTPSITKPSTEDSSAIPQKIPKTTPTSPTITPPTKVVPDTVRRSTPITTTPIKPIKISKPAETTQKSTTSPPLSTPQVVQPKPIQGTIIPSDSSSGPTIKANLNPNLPFPSLPEKVNTLVGMVLTKEGKIVDNAVIEIQDQSSRTVRATKTNKIGQFFLATPLDSGSYLIKTEKDGLLFSTISLLLEDKIYPPLEIRAN